MIISFLKAALLDVFSLKPTDYFVAIHLQDKIFTSLLQ